MSKQQQTGMQGVYLVAAELAARGWIVSPTSRSAAGADLLVTNEDCSVAYSVQVKTNAKPTTFWLVSEKAKRMKAATHLYVFVNINPKTGDHEYFVVPSEVVATAVVVAKHREGTWYSFYKKDAEVYRADWKQIGTASGVSAPAEE